MIALVTLATARRASPAQLAAGAAGATVVLSQASESDAAGSVHAVTATATKDDGQPVPDGTSVSFTISGPDGAVTVDGVSDGAPIDESRRPRTA